MWDTVGIIAALIVIILLLQLLDVSEVLKTRLRGQPSRDEMVGRVAKLEERLAALERKAG